MQTKVTITFKQGKEDKQLVKVYNGEIGAKQVSVAIHQVPKGASVEGLRVERV